MKIKTKNILFISYIFLTSIIIFLVIGNVFGWYIGLSNDAKAESNEIKTVTTGYGGRFTTGEDYIAHNDVYQADDSVTTTAVVKPGDVVFFTFIMEFDRTTYQSSIQGSTIDVDIVLIAGANQTNEYRGITTGDFYSFLHNTGIPQNTATCAIAQKLYDSSRDSFKYTKTSEPTVTNTSVSNFSSTNNSSGIIGCQFSVTFPSGMVFPTSYSDAANSVDDGNYYFMIYLPIFYQDTNELQNNEMNSYVKISTVIYKLSTN